MFEVTLHLSPELDAFIKNELHQQRKQLAHLDEKVQMVLHQQKEFMSQISTFAATVKANFDTIKKGILALDQKITDLQNSPGAITPEDQAALDEIQALSGQLATAASTFPPPAPPPTP